MSFLDADQYVRLYFHLDLKFLIPPNPNYSVISCSQWERGQIEKIEANLQDIMREQGFELEYVSHCCDDKIMRLFCVRFVIVRLYKIHSKQIAVIKKKCGIFRIRERSLKKIVREIENNVRRILEKDNYFIGGFHYMYATCRNFNYEIYLGGCLKVEHSISKKEIAYSGGSIRDAIVYFNSLVIDCFEQAGLIARSSSSEMRRPVDNVFKYDINASLTYCFSENDVLGDFAKMHKNMSQQEAIDLMIDCDDQQLIDAISGTRDCVENDLLLNLPENTIIKELNLDFVDYDEELQCYSDSIP